MHVALECPFYSDLHGPVLESLPADPGLAMHLLFCPPHFRPLAHFLCACHVGWVECVVGRLALPLESEMTNAFAAPRPL